jgi:hypothetical protein
VIRSNFLSLFKDPTMKRSSMVRKSGMVMKSDVVRRQRM